MLYRVAADHHASVPVLDAPITFLHGNRQLGKVVGDVQKMTGNPRTRNIPPYASKSGQLPPVLTVLGGCMALNLLAPWPGQEGPNPGHNTGRSHCHSPGGGGGREQSPAVAHVQVEEASPEKKVRSQQHQKAPRGQYPTHQP